MRSILLILSFLIVSFAVQLRYCTRIDQTAEPVRSYTAAIDTPAKRPKKKDLIRPGDNVGIVTRENDRTCLTIGNGSYQAGDPVFIVTEIYYPPITIVKGMISRRSEQRCEGIQDIDVVPFKTRQYFEIDIKKTDADRIVWDLAIVKPAGGVLVQRGTVSVDIDGDGRREYLRHCAGIEGSVLSLWKGRPLRGRKIWYAYNYLGYDTVQTCTKKD